MESRFSTKELKKLKPLFPLAVLTTSLMGGLKIANVNCSIGADIDQRWANARFDCHDHKGNGVTIQSWGVEDSTTGEINIATNLYLFTANKLGEPITVYNQALVFKNKDEAFPGARITNGMSAGHVQ